MSSDVRQQAVKMLIGGATLLAQPCPYCKGVRVMKDGHALCINCGRQPQKRPLPEPQTVKRSDLKVILENKLLSLTKQLKNEKDHAKQQELLRSLNSLLEAIDKL